MIFKSKLILAAFSGCILGISLTTGFASDVSLLSENEKQESFKQRYARAKENFLSCDSKIGFFKGLEAENFADAVRSLEKDGAKLDEDELRLFLINNCGEGARECMIFLTERMISKGELDNAICILETLINVDNQLIKAFLSKKDFNRVKNVYERVVANFNPLQVVGGYEEGHPRARYAKFLCEIGDYAAAKTQYEAMSKDANPGDVRYAQNALKSMNAYQ